jgi:hypothetical protein
LQTRGNGVLKRTRGDQKHKSHQVRTPDGFGSAEGLNPRTVSCYGFRLSSLAAPERLPVSGSISTNWGNTSTFHPKQSRSWPPCSGNYPRRRCAWRGRHSIIGLSARSTKDCRWMGRARAGRTWLATSASVGRGLALYSDVLLTTKTPTIPGRGSTDRNLISTTSSTPSSSRS